MLSSKVNDKQSAYERLVEVDCPKDIARKKENWNTQQMLKSFLL